MRVALKSVCLSDLLLVKLWSDSSSRRVVVVESWIGYFIVYVYVILFLRIVYITIQK